MKKPALIIFALSSVAQVNLSATKLQMKLMINAQIHALVAFIRLLMMNILVLLAARISFTIQLQETKNAMIIVVKQLLISMKCHLMVLKTSSNVYRAVQAAIHLLIKKMEQHALLNVIHKNI